MFEFSANNHKTVTMDINRVWQHKLKTSSYDVDDTLTSDGVGSLGDLFSEEGFELAEERSRERREC